MRGCLVDEDVAGNDGLDSHKGGRDMHGDGVVASVVRMASGGIEVQPRLRWC